MNCILLSVLYTIAAANCEKVFGKLESVDLNYARGSKSQVWVRCRNDSDEFYFGKIQIKEKCIRID